MTKEERDNFMLRIQGLSKQRDDCIEWVGHYSCINHIAIFYQKNKVRYSIPVKRFVLKYSGRSICDNEVVRMKCDNKLCINPKHMMLSLKSEMAKENRDKMSAKHSISVSKARRKLSNLDWDKVHEIRNSEMTTRHFAEKFGVSFSTISQIRLHKTWKESWVRL